MLSLKATLYVICQFLYYLMNMNLIVPYIKKNQLYIIYRIIDTEHNVPTFFKGILERMYA